jgi:phage FluMu protein Com
MFKRYHLNTRTFRCAKCKYVFALSFWQWLLTTMKVDFVEYRYVKCPRCGARHWLQTKKVV